MSRLFALISVVVMLGLCGCASYKARSYSAKPVASYPRYFVVNNLDDNHHVDQYLVAAFKAAGHEAESGPETMQPDDTQIIVYYRDAWNWDFSEHLVELHIQMRDAKYGYLLATANFDGPVTMKTSPEAVCMKLVKEILSAPLGKPANRPDKKEGPGGGASKAK